MMSLEESVKLQEHHQRLMEVVLTITGKAKLC